MVSRESTSSSTSTVHPFANSHSPIEIIRGIDVEEEARLYDAMCEDDYEDRPAPKANSRPDSKASSRPESLFSRQSIWLESNLGASQAFTRDVKISGWTRIGDKPGGGAYIVYDCVIKTKEGTTIHAHKRYNAFVELEAALRRSLPAHQTHFIPKLPPKTPLAKFRPAFLDRRRKMLEHFLWAVLLHPELGSCPVVRLWIME
ncbi:Phox homologous domain-containing protein [Mycena floridula]|nr:Phox homologous domain-containing protein [Mycena floridula]